MSSTTALPATQGHGNLWAVSRSQGFRRLVAVRLVSQSADGLFQAGLAGSLLFNPQQRATPVAIATGFAVLLLPYSLVGPYVGVVLDRWSRRTVICVANLIRAGLVLPTAALVWSSHQSLLYAGCALLIIGINRLFLAGLSAAQPHVVSTDRLVTANAVATTLGTLIYSLGLGLAATGLNTVLHKNAHGYAALSLMAAFGYLASGLLIKQFFGTRDLGPDDSDQGSAAILPAIVSVARGMLAGAGHLVARRPAAYAMLAQSLHRVLYGVLTLATLLLYRRYFYPDSESAALAGLAEVVVAGGFGSLLAAFVTPPVTRRIGGWRWITVLFAGTGVLVLALGMPMRPVLLVLATFFVNLASQGTKIVVDTTLQRECDDEFRGRVFSVNDTTFNLALVVGLFGAAMSLPADGHSVPAILVVSAGYLVLSAWYGLASRVHRAMAGTQAVPPTEATPQTGTATSSETAPQEGA